MAVPKKKHNISDLFVKKGFMPYSAAESTDGEKQHDEHDEAYYEELLEFAVALANRLQACGAETYRVEETIVRVIEAYGVEKVDTFVIPSSIMASLETNDVVLTKIRRLKSGGTMLDGIERYSALCRRICIEKPDLKTARKLLVETDRSIHEYGPVIYYLAAFLIGFGFGIFFGGKLAEALAAGVCGIATGASLRFMGRFRANAFFTSFVCSFILAFIANALTAVGLCKNADIATIGAMMILVPGFLFTNSLRDVIYGDTLSGVNRLVQVLIIAVALVFGTSAAVSLARQLFPSIISNLEPLVHPIWLQCLAGMIGTLGFGLMFNMHGHGIPLALFGSIISWLVCSLSMGVGVSEPISYLFAAAASGFYAEIMARIRKFPATSYLLCALVPLIPGAGIYYTMDFIRRGMGPAAYDKGVATAAIAGSVAVGVLLVSTGFRMWGVYKKRRLKALNKK
ncbi:MAG: threonine/serine exporter family protein [Clostridia bacterium]|nr:threonine/serine exporter family protein [Clostridia bacterium]